ncbi:hypothetical protein NC651_025954 [Populus alba x Populus x berolinensis]|nr:hypothetical protein NC651_025954 [Populus alba x Populus x berolinensis]
MLKEEDVKPIPDISDKTPRKVISATIHCLKITVFEFQDSSTHRNIPCQQTIQARRACFWTLQMSAA